MATVRLVKGQPDHHYPEGVEPVRDEKGKVVPLAAGVPIEVDDEIAKGLLAQNDKWERAPKSARPVTSDDDKDGD